MPSVDLHAVIRLLPELSKPQGTHPTGHPHVDKYNDSSKYYSSSYERYIDIVVVIREMQI